MVLKKKPATKKTTKTVKTQSVKTFKGRKLTPIKKNTCKKVIRPTKTTEKKYKHPRNMALVESLDKIERNSMNRKTEQACYVDKETGKCLFCASGTKNSVTPSDKQIEIIRKMGKKLIVTHNHPYPYSSAPTCEDLEVVSNNDGAGLRAITKRWTYVVIRPEKGWNFNWSDIAPVYNKIYNAMEKKWNDDYQNDRITKFYYEDNLTHKVMEKVAKKLGFKYFRFRN